MKPPYLVVIPVLCMLAVACRTEERGFGVNAGVVSDSQGVKILHLERSLNDIASLSAGADAVLELDLGGDEPGFGKIADVKGADGGSFWVLDRFEKTLSLYDSAGQVVRSFGREGLGPGELKDPWTFLIAGSDLIVWQNYPLQTFLRYTAQGQYVTSVNRPVDGDWTAHIFREPVVLMDDYQFGPEDITTRFQAKSDSEFVIGVQVDESHRAAQKLPVQLESPALDYVRIDRNLQVRDTFVTLRGADLVSGSAGPGLPVFSQPLFIARPQLAFGDGWHAVAHGDSAEVRVFRRRPPALLVRWPGEERRVTGRDIEAAVDWVIQEGIKDSFEAERHWRRLGRLQKEKIREREALKLMPVEVAPHIMAMRAAGRCLWLAGFNAADNWNGIASSWLVIDVVQAQVVGQVRVPAGERLRDITESWAYTTFTDQDDLWRVRRYRLPMNCQDQQQD